MMVEYKIIIDGKEIEGVLDDCKVEIGSKVYFPEEVFPLYTKQALVERWGVSRQTVDSWAARHTDFPKPIEGLVMGGGPYYPLYEVERYEKTRGLNK